MYHTEAETSRADANMGLCLYGNGKGEYEEIHIGDSGFYTPGDVKHLEMIDFNNQKLILVANNNAKFQSYLTNFEEQ